MTHSPARSAIDVGSVIAGTYTIEALIGRGGMGAVFLASHARLPGKKVAIKVLHADVSTDEILVRFKREAQIASLLSHPNIVHIEDYNVTADGMPYLVLEYLQGESLAQRIRRGPMSVDAALSVIRQVGSALAAAHAKGIVHRDLKPQNIFLVPSEIDGRTLEIAKVLDFGISKMRDSQTVKTQESALLGTPQYMAPEQATGQHDKVDERTDIFALGAIVYEMLSGTPAFSGQTIPEVVFKVVYEQPVDLGTRVPTVPDAIQATVHRAMAKPQEERYANVSAFIEALTGAPVSIVRPAAAIAPPAPAFDGTGPTSASGQTPHTGREAFDKTVSSGDHAVPPVAPPPVDVGARTLDTHSGARRTAASAADGVARTVPSGELSLPSPTAPRARTALVAAGVLAAGVAAAAIVYVVRREPPAPPPTTVASQTPVVALDAAVVRPEPPPVERALLDTPLDAGVVDAAPLPADAAVRTRSAPPVTATSDDDDAADDSRVGQKLKEATAAIARGDWAAASAAAQLVYAAEDAKPTQRAHATMLKGVVACNTNDEEAARGAYRALAGRAKMRLRLLAACHRNDLLQSLSR